jgi:tetratricopeptide (TPR) repeat protein
MHRLKLLIYQLTALALILAGCSSSGPVRQVDPELYRTAKSARTAFSQGQYEQAARLYQRSLNRARVMDNALEIGNNAYNLAACSIELGEYDRARQVLEEARAAFKRVGKVPGSLSILAVKISLAQGRTEEAQELLASAEDGRGDNLTAEMEIQYGLLRAALALQLMQPEKAGRELEDIRAEIPEVGVKALEAEADRLEGELLMLEGKFSTAGSSFDRRADILRDEAHYSVMAIALGRAGEAYRNGGEDCKALDRFFRSARSLFAQEDTTGALIMIESALEVTRNCEEESLRQQVRELFDEIRDSVDDLPAENNE